MVRFFWQKQEQQKFSVFKYLCIIYLADIFSQCEDCVLTWNKYFCQVFLSKDRFVWDQWRIPIQGLQPGQATRGAKEVGRALVNKESMTFHRLSPCQERRGVFSCWGTSWNGSHHSAIPWLSLVIIVHSTNSISDYASQADNHVDYINSKLSSPEELCLTIGTKRYLDLRFYHCKISLLGIKIKYAL